MAFLPGPDHGLVRLPGRVPALERQEEAETLGRTERPQRRRSQVDAAALIHSWPPVAAVI